MEKAYYVIPLQPYYVSQLWVRKSLLRYPFFIEKKAYYVSLLGGPEVEIEKKNGRGGEDLLVGQGRRHRGEHVPRGVRRVAPRSFPG